MRDLTLRKYLCFIIVMRAGSDLMEFMKYSDIKPWKAMLGPFMQVNFFSIVYFKSMVLLSLLGTKALQTSLRLIG